MKKFWINLLKFSVPLFLAALLIFFKPVDRKYAYSFVNKGGCEGRSAWIYRNIFEDTGQIDVAFIGSSHSMCAVNDEGIEKEFNDSAKTNLHFKNLAYCRLGRNFDYLVVRDLLQHKKVKAIVLEIRQEESQYGHPSFAQVATVSDLLDAPLLYNQLYISDLYHAFLLHVQYLREVATGEEVRHEVDVPATEYGFNGTDRVADRDELNKKPRRKDVSIPFVERGLNAYPMKYVEKIAELANKHHASLIFLYLPKYGFAQPSEKTQSKYSHYGKIIFAPPPILNDPSDWADQEHLNVKAANQLSGYLATELKRDICM